MTPRSRLELRNRLGEALYRKVTQPTCVVCGVDDSETLYWWVDAEDSERCMAHADCGEDAGLEDGTEAVDP